MHTLNSRDRVNEFIGDAFGLSEEQLAGEQLAGQPQPQLPPIQVRFSPNDKGMPPGKLADVGLVFNDGVLAGMKLMGFGLWQRRGQDYSVTFPSRVYRANGESRSFALLRPAGDIYAQLNVKRFIIDAWKAHRAATLPSVKDEA